MKRRLHTPSLFFVKDPTLQTTTRNFEDAPRTKNGVLSLMIQFITLSENLGQYSFFKKCHESNFTCANCWTVPFCKLAVHRFRR